LRLGNITASKGGLHAGVLVQRILNGVQKGFGACRLRQGGIYSNNSGTQEKGRKTRGHQNDPKM